MSSKPTLNELIKKRQELDKEIKLAKARDLKNRGQLKDEAAKIIGSYVIKLTGKSWWAIDWEQVIEMLDSIKFELENIDKYENLSEIKLKELKTFVKNSKKQKKVDKSILISGAEKKEEEPAPRGKEFGD